MTLTPTMEVLLGRVGELAGVEATPENAEELVAEFGPAARMLGAVISNSVNPTMLEAGYKSNVVPGEAKGTLDGRFLPGHEEEFLGTLRELAGPGIAIDAEALYDAPRDPLRGPEVDRMRAALLAEDPEALMAPYLMSGGTDAKHWDRLGIRCFGFAPLRLPADLDFTGLFHGVDERVPVDSLEFGGRGSSTGSSARLCPAGPPGGDGGRPAGLDGVSEQPTGAGG